MKKILVVSLFFLSIFGVKILAQGQEKDFFLCSKKDSILSVKSIRPFQVLHEKKSSLLSCDKGEQILLKTADGYEFAAIFFDRGKENIVIFGQGFPGSKDAMIPEASLLDECDAIIFDYRWNDLSTFLSKLSHWFPLGKSLISSSAEEVIAVLKFIKNKKKYKEVIGLGQCYSCYTFLRAQYIQEKTLDPACFSKLILDSSWASIFSFTKTLQYDPMLAVNPQNSGTSEIIKSGLALPGVRHAISGFFYMGLPEISVKKYLKKVMCPMLFLHGSDDLLIPYETGFLPMFTEFVSEERALAVIMPTGHVNLSTNHKEFYRVVCNLFIYGGKKKVLESFA